MESAPTSSTSSYEIQGVIPFIGVGITLPSGTSESISGSTNPWNEIQLPPGAAVLVSNITWTFNIGMSANNAGFPNAFEYITPAMVVLPSLSTTSTAAFPIDFENYAVTSWVYCSFFTDQTIWVNALWVISIVPQSSNIVNLTQPYLNIYIIQQYATKHLHNRNIVKNNTHTMPGIRLNALPCTYGLFKLNCRY